MIETYIERRFPGDSPLRVTVRNELIRVCKAFVERELSDPKFVQELTSGKDTKFWSCVSEALLADRLRDKNFPKRSNRGAGPDFLVMEGTRRVWVEVVCPEPINIPEEWLSFESAGVVDFPYKEILLRWTSAIKVKAESLVGTADGSIKGYLQKGVVASNDAYVIAINGCQLRNPAFTSHTGISSLPFAAEAVFPIGPFELRIDKSTLEVVERGYQHRPYIQNANGSQVSAYAFLDPRFKPVSAIWAVDLNGGNATSNSGPMSVIHNPNAINPIPLGFLPADEEFVATPSQMNEFTLSRVSASGASAGS